MDAELLANAQRLQEQLGRHQATVSTAESCTGGILATALTHFPGSSDTYLGGGSVYSNHAKTKLLSVPQHLIAEVGAVSAEVAEAMAHGVRTVLGSTYALSLTGVAGPGGGSPEKPVGTVWLGFASPHAVETRLYNFAGDRDKIRVQAAQAALLCLLEALDRS